MRFGRRNRAHPNSQRPRGRATIISATSREHVRGFFDALRRVDQSSSMTNKTITGIYEIGIRSMFVSIDYNSPLIDRRRQREEDHEGPTTRSRGFSAHSIYIP